MFPIHRIISCTISCFVFIFVPRFTSPLNSPRTSQCVCTSPPMHHHPWTLSLAELFSPLTITRPYVYNHHIIYCIHIVWSVHCIRTHPCPTYPRTRFTRTTIAHWHQCIVFL